jgi:anti-sigma regulatory factor (Ser/Thr protein kinase)
MVGTAAETGQRLIAFVLPSTSESVPMARFHVRAVLGFHGLGQYADDAAAIASELVTNAIQHVCATAPKRSG